MKLYIKQKVFSWRNKFTVKTELGDDKYLVEAEPFTMGRKLCIYNIAGGEVACIQQESWIGRPRFAVYCLGRQVAVIRKEFTFFRPKYVIEGLGWEIEGDFWTHDYRIREFGSIIASISKEWFTWGDSYVLNIQDPEVEVVALAVVLAIDRVISSDGVSVSVSVD